MTLPNVIRILRQIEAEAQEVDTSAAAWVAEARKAITEEWDRELLEECEDLFPEDYAERAFHVD